MSVSPIPTLPAVVLASVALLLPCQGWQAMAQATQTAAAQTAQQANATPTFHSTSNLVYLDSTVVDSKGNVVTSGLNRNDFTIVEDKTPQRITSFQAPGTEPHGGGTGSDHPVTVFVLDLQNAAPQSAAYYRSELRRWLYAQPKTLPAPAALFVVKADGLELAQNFTRSNHEFADTLDHLPAYLAFVPREYKLFPGFMAPLDILYQIALVSRTVPGKKDLVWFGYGIMDVDTTEQNPKVIQAVHNAVRDTLNQLIDARVSLSEVLPGLSPMSTRSLFDPNLSDLESKTNDPFGRFVINDDLLARATGGAIYANGTDLVAQINRSLQLLENSYLLTYEPTGNLEDGNFRHVTVAVNKPGLRVITKSGYYAPDAAHPETAKDSTAHAVEALVLAADSKVPFHGLRVATHDIIRYPAAQRVGLTALVSAQSLPWQPEDGGGFGVNVYFALTADDSAPNVLAMHAQRVHFHVPILDATVLAHAELEAQLQVRMPRRTKALRLVVEGPDTQAVASVDIDQKQLRSSPQKALPAPAKAP